jgi:hypothetical protein
MGKRGIEGGLMLVSELRHFLKYAENDDEIVVCSDDKEENIQSLKISDLRLIPTTPILKKRDNVSFRSN